MKNPEVFVTALKTFKDTVDAGLVPAGNVAYVKKEYFTEGFDPEIMKNKSRAASGLCSWVLNIVKFYDVIQDVGPKRKALEESTVQL
jgi:dynein heavy chain